VEDSGDGTRLQLEGWLVGPWVEEVRTHGERALAESKPLSLDLGKLLFVDPTGASLLRELSRRGVTCLNCSNFLKEQLKEIKQ
jgi:hypothetical protein